MVPTLPKLARTVVGVVVLTWDGSLKAVWTITVYQAASALFAAGSKLCRAGGEGGASLPLPLSLKVVSLTLPS